MSIIDPNSPGLFSFFAPKAGAPSTAPGMEARRRIALQLLANSKKGFPKTFGEGLTALGDAIGDRAVLEQLGQMESGYYKQAAAAAEGAIPTDARPASPGPQSSLSPEQSAPVAAAALQPPAEPEPGVVGASYNPLDAASDARDAAATTAASGYRPAPAYLRAALEQNVQDPQRRAYLGHLAGKEAQSASEVSPTGAAGPFQFTRGTGRQYGLMPGGVDKRTDIAMSILAANRLTDDNARTLAARLGREPSPGELALAHQQGAGTAANMLTGAGNAPARNLAVNNVAPGMGPQAAAQRIMAYYGMPGAGAGAPAPASATPAAQPLTMADAEASDRLGDVTGMGSGDRGYSYPPIASLGRTGDVISDAPPVSGISPAIGAAAADTVQQRRDALARASMSQPSMPDVSQPPIGPMGPTAMASPTPNVTSDIRPAPSATPPIQPAPVQLAQAALPGVPPGIPAAPLTGLPQRPVPPAPPVRMPMPDDVPMTNDEKRGWRMRATGAAMGDPSIQAQGQALIEKGVRDKQQEYEARVKAYQDQVAAPGRALEQQQRELELAKGKAFGGVDQVVLFKPIEESAKQVQAIPQAQVSIRNAVRTATEGNMFTGSTAESKTSLKKLLASAGFPVDPRVEATEEFKSYIKPILASARQALVGGANISDNDIKLAEAAVGGDVKLERGSIVHILGALERMNVATATGHQRKLEAIAGDDPQRQSVLFGAFGLPMENIVPRAAVELLKSQPTPEVMEQFNRKYHTPGLAQRMLGGG